MHKDFQRFNQRDQIDTTNIGYTKRRTYVFYGRYARTLAILNVFQGMRNIWDIVNMILLICFKL
jgi:hypothetical protein